MKQTATQYMKYASVCLISLSFSIAHGMSKDELIRAVQAMSKEDINRELVLAAQGGDAAVARILLDQRADVDAIFSEQDNASTSLIQASKNNHLPVVKLLLERNANPDLGVPPRNVTPLLTATLLGHAAVVDKLLEQANPNQADVDGFTPLMLASKAGNTPVVQKLLDAKASIDTQSKPSKTYGVITAQKIAASNGHSSVVALLEQARTHVPSAHGSADKKDSTTEKNT